MVFILFAAHHLAADAEGDLIRHTAAVNIFRRLDASGPIASVCNVGVTAATRTRAQPRDASRPRGRGRESVDALGEEVDHRRATDGQHDSQNQPSLVNDDTPWNLCELRVLNDCQQCSITVGWHSQCCGAVAVASNTDVLDPQGCVRIVAAADKQRRFVKDHPPTRRYVALMMFCGSGARQAPAGPIE